MIFEHLNLKLSKLSENERKDYLKKNTRAMILNPIKEFHPILIPFNEWDLNRLDTKSNLNVKNIQHCGFPINEPFSDLERPLLKEINKYKGDSFLTSTSFEHPLNMNSILQLIDIKNDKKKLTCPEILNSKEDKLLFLLLQLCDTASFYSKGQLLINIESNEEGASFLVIIL